MKIRSTLVIACGFAASCSTAGSNNGNNDNGGVDPPQGSATEVGSHGSMPTDAPPDSPKLTTGVYAIPLSTPTNGDQGTFYTPSLTASGKSFLLDLATCSTVTGVIRTRCSRG